MQVTATPFRSGPPLRGCGGDTAGGENTPNALLVVALLEAYPAINAGWLLRGKGAME